MGQLAAVEHPLLQLGCAYYVRATAASPKATSTLVSGGLLAPHVCGEPFLCRIHAILATKIRR